MPMFDDSSGSQTVCHDIKVLGILSKLSPEYPITLCSGVVNIFAASLQFNNGSMPLILALVAVKGPVFSKRLFAFLSANNLIATLCPPKRESSGLIAFNPPVFIIVSLISRSLRFFIVAFLSYKFGDLFTEFMNNHGSKWFTVIGILIVIIFAIIYLVLKFNG